MSISQSVSQSVALVEINAACGEAFQLAMLASHLCGFEVWGSWFEVFPLGLGLGVGGLGFGLRGVGFGVWCLGFGV